MPSGSNPRNLRHGHTWRGGNTRTYSAWFSMRMRCSYKKNDSYYWYGGAGIKVCKRWRIFDNFLADMGVCPDGLTLHRINSKKGYSPKNCKWADWHEQSRNKTNNDFYCFNGKKLILTDWSKELGIALATLKSRSHRRWSTRDMLTTPVRPDRRYV